MKKLGFVLLFLKILFIGLSFIGPIVIIIRDYGGNEEIVKTTSTLHFGWLAVIAIIAIVLVWLLYNALISSIRKHPFGLGTLLFFGGLVILMLVPIMLAAYTVKDLVENNVELFLANMDTYIGTLWKIIGMQVGGLFALLIGFAIKVQS